MKCVVEDRNGVTVIRLSGTLNADGSYDLVDCLRPYIAEPRRIVVNLCGVTDADSEGLHGLMTMRKDAKRFGADLRLCGITGELEDLLSQLNSIIFATEEEAIASLPQTQ